MAQLVRLVPGEDDNQSVGSQKNLFGGSEADLDWDLIRSQCNPFDAPPCSEPSQLSLDNTVETLSKQQFDRYLGHAFRAFLSVPQTTDLKMP